MKRLASVLVCVLACCSAPIWAQSPDAVLAGRVVDPAGLGVPAAEVRVKALHSDLERSAQSGADGAFRVGALPAGTYHVRVEHQGFAPYELDRVDLQVRQVVDLEIRLALGGRNETVRVQGQLALVDAAPAGVGFSVAEAQIRELPLIQRNFIELATLGPGVVPRALTGFVHDTLNDLQPGRGATALNPQINGTRSTANTFLLDGIQNTDGNINAVVVNPPLESVQEVRVQASATSAEFGYAGGGVINVVTRSGGSQYHGGVFEFLRNQALDAHGFFDPPGQPKPAFRQHQFGAQLGGALPRLSHWFFFASYEGLLSANGKLKHTSVPDAAMRSGDFSAVDPITDPVTGLAFPNKRIPGQRISSVARIFLDKFQPLPNGPNNQLFSGTPDKRNTETGSFRLDKNTARWGSFFARYTLNDDGAVLNASFPLLPDNETVRAQQFTVGNTLTGKGWVNELRAGFNRLVVEELPLTAFKRDVVGELGMSGLNRDPINWGLPIFNLGNFTLTTDDPTLPQVQHDLTYHVLDQFTLQRGKHTFSMGGEFRRFQQNFLQLLNGRGLFNFSGQFTGYDFADFLLGDPNETQRVSGLPQAYLRRLSYAFYGQDEYRVRPGLMLTAGLRYNYTSPFSDAGNNMYNLDYSRLPAAPSLVRGSQVRPDHNDFAPRAALAWQPLQGKSLLFRAGYGIFYSPEIAAEYYDLVRNSVHNEINEAPKGAPVLTLTNGFPSTASTGFASYFGLQDNVPTPYVQQWNASWQTSFHSMVFEAAYVGNKATHLGRFRNYNTPLQVELGRSLAPRPGDLQSLRSFPSLGPILQRQHIANSNFHSLQLRLEKRFSKTLQFQASYTWAKAIDDSDNNVQGLYDNYPAQDERNLRLERGLSFYDVRNRLTFNAQYNLPFGTGRRWASSGAAASVFGGWQLAGITLLQGGMPSNPVYFFSDFANTGTPNRPNVVPGVSVSLPRDQRTVERFFNRGAFSDPAPFTFGNAGRDVLPGPGVAIVDLAVHRTFAVSERGTLEFRAESFNAFNHPNWGIPIPNPDFGPFFGRVHVAGDPRRIQFALKLGF